jgi:hypothetical protein
MTSKSRLIAIATVLGLALSSVSVPAGSQPATPTKEQRDEAKTRFLKGLDLFREGDYQAALIEFRRANELAPNYNVLYNIGQVYFQLTDYPNALTSLERYLKEGGDQVSAKRREEVQRDIDKLRARIAYLDVTTNVAEVDIAIDDISQGRTPLAKPLMVGAGRHRITASKEGYRTVTKVVEVAGADSLKIPLELQEQKSGTPAPTNTTPVTPPPVPTGTATTTATTAPTRPPVVDEGSGIPWAGWAVTGALAAGAVVTGVLALSASSELETQRSQVGATRETLDAQSSKVGTLALVSDILTGCAVVAGGVSLYFTVTAGPSKPSDAKEGTTPAAGLQKVRVGLVPGGVNLSGQF